MDKKLIDQGLGNPEELCVKIRQEADAQCRDILEMARKEADKILSGAQKEAETQRARMLQDLDKELERTRERVFSTVNLGKKKILLEEKSFFVNQALETVKKLAEGLRESREYPAFFKRAILEGVGVVDVEQIDVFYSFLDEKLIGGDIKEISAACRAKFNKDFAIDFKKDDFRDIGVVVKSRDGRLLYDNRFAARLQRDYDELYTSLLKESF